VLTDLVRRGVPAPDATMAVTTVAASQPDNALLSLQSAIARETSAPTAAQLRDAVQRQLRQRPPLPDLLPDDGLVRALDGRTSPAAGHAVYVALSALNPQPTSTGVWTALEGGFMPLSSALSLSAGRVPDATSPIRSSCRCAAVVVHPRAGARAPSPPG
jgi:hypothetical protein